MSCQPSSSHRHIYGKWACRHRRILKQAPSVREIACAHAASGLLAQHRRRSAASWITCRTTGRRVSTRARACTPCAQPYQRRHRWGVALEPLYELHKRFILDCRGRARRRNAGGLARPGRRKDTPGLHGLTREAGMTRRPASSTSSAEALRSGGVPGWQQQAWRAALVRHLADRPLQCV